MCHSSTTISSCCSMIMHGPMLQGSLHNSWKLKTYQFLHGQLTHRTCHPLSMFAILWVWRILQRVPVPANIQQLRTAIEEEWTNIPQATINNLINSMRRRCVALHEANGGHTRFRVVFIINTLNMAHLRGIGPHWDYYTLHIISQHFHTFVEIAAFTVLLCFIYCLY